ncbi:hypothetical protein AX15_002324 [Amanita polypyramis BW_CC]|nr:hypothetical protein AX15_002324 [Amanita polypyramis BW_CC]
MPAKVLQQNHQELEHSVDAALLDFLTGPTLPSKAGFARRDAALDPLLVAVVAASGPHITRNHYHHDFLPAHLLSLPEGKKDPTKRFGDDSSSKTDRKRLAYVSRQAPRRQRLQNILNEERKENDNLHDDELSKTVDRARKRRPSQLIVNGVVDVKNRAVPSAKDGVITFTKSPKPSLEIRCMARTRIPTPHGPVFLHLYHNNHDKKEHLAIVIDPAQLSDNPGPLPAPPIRSRSLDAVWDEKETEMDRIMRGAYVGRLSTSSAQAAPSSPSEKITPLDDGIPPPLIRIHSECFTGETVGSMRCDCGEQLDEAIRQISQPIHVSEATTIPGRGAVIYMRQEGRGIGLLSKIRAYNLQDMGHDTVSANLMLGYKADERGYEIAAAILSDLGMGNGGKGKGVRVLTNNPDKVEALEREGIKVVDRVTMIPRSWQQRHQQKEMGGHAEQEKIIGATMVGGNAVHGEDLDKYLKTKVLRMGHMLPLWLDGYQPVVAPSVTVALIPTMDSNYSAIGMSQALERSKARRKRSRWIVVGSLVALVAVIVIVVAIAVTLSRKTNKSSSSSSSDSSPQLTNPNDPSSFVKDTRLHQSFYGMAYTPANSQYPQCGNSLDDVIKDIQVMSQLTTRVRLYGADCNQTQLVLEAIQQTKVNMTVYPGNYVLPSDDAGYQRQRDALLGAVQKYGTNNIGGLTVGNEFMLNYLTSHQATDPNGSVGQQGASLLLNYISDTKSKLSAIGVSLPIGTADAGSFFNNQVLSNVDYGMSNVHAWFANQTVNNAASWVFNFFETTNAQPAAALANKPKMYIAETGWPTNSSDAGNETNGASNASVASLQVFLDTFVCQANQQGIPYFYFEFFDEKWKDIQFGGVEGYWGLFTGSRTLKDVNIPNCQSP